MSTTRAVMQVVYMPPATALLMADAEQLCAPCSTWPNLHSCEHGTPAIQGIIPD
jgi:hypothetical protein